MHFWKLFDLIMALSFITNFAGISRQEGLL